VTPVFADTFYYIALLSHRDARHDRVAALAESLDSPTVTTAWVLTEVGDALAAPAERPRFVGLLDALREDPDCTVVPASQELFDRGVQLYRERPDKDWSLTDCISFVVMREHGLTEALTGDHHFDQAGFTILLE
jgi:hypothetical protein